MKNHLRLWGTFLSVFLAVVGQAFLVQKDLPWTLAPGLFFYGIAIFLFISGGIAGSPTGRPEAGLSAKTELGWLAAVGALILFFHLYRSFEVPPGIMNEAACPAWLGYGMPPQGWPEFYTGGLALTHPDIPLWAFGWFHLFTPSYLSYETFYLFLSLPAFPLGYLLFRDLAGPKAALLALFLWGIMQWPLTLERNGHPVLSTLFYLMGASYFGRLAWRTGKKRFWALAGLFCGLGFYAYPIARACLPLVLCFGAFERFFGPPRVRLPKAGAVLFLAALVAVCVPQLGSMGQQHSWLTGSPHEQAFIGWKILEQKSLEPLWDNLSQVSLVFNREGSPNPVESLPYRRLLDDATGVLFVLGLFFCLARWRQRKYFYGIAGTLILLLPSLLSDQPLHTRRMLGAAPFIAYLAALAALEMWERTAESQAWRRTAWVCGILAALLGLSENFKTYFLDRPGSEACWAQSNPDATQAGQAIAGLGGSYEYFLSSAYFERFQVLFLGHSQAGHMHPLDLPACFHYLSPPPGRGLCFVIQQGRTGVLAVLQKRWPGGVTEKLTDPWSRPYLYLFRVPPQACAPDKFVPLPRRYYWEGTYKTSLDPGAKPALVERDPVLNFSYRDDFPVKYADTLWIEWKGTLHPGKAGFYEFLMAATDHDQAEMRIDGKRIAGSNQEAKVYLGPVDHRVVIRLIKKGGIDNAFHLVWKPPGAVKYEVLPPEALR